jgi:hypothetical protein
MKIEVHSASAMCNVQWRVVALKIQTQPGTSPMRTHGACGEYAPVPTDELGEDFPITTTTTRNWSLAGVLCARNMHPTMALVVLKYLSNGNLFDANYLQHRQPADALGCFTDDQSPDIPGYSTDGTAT